MLFYSKIFQLLKCLIVSVDLTEKLIYGLAKEVRQVLLNLKEELWEIFQSFQYFIIRNLFFIFK